MDLLTTITKCYIGLFIAICVTYILILKNHVKKLEEHIKALDNINEHLVYQVEQLKERKTQITYNTA